jgi:hypothetical protein
MSDEAENKPVLVIPCSGIGKVPTKKEVKKCLPDFQTKYCEI